MLLYDRFLIEPIGNAPTAHIINQPTLYIGTPYLLIGPSIMYTKTPLKDVLNTTDLAEAYTTLVEEIMKNKPYPPKYETIEVKTWYYPITEEKYLVNKFQQIKESTPAEISKVPVKKPPAIKIVEYKTGKFKIIPTIEKHIEVIDGIPVAMNLKTVNNKTTATLVPPELGMTTPIFLNQALTKIQNPYLKELVEKYLDGLEIPDLPKLKYTNDEWVGKRVMIKYTYATIKKILLHSHNSTFFNP